MNRGNRREPIFKDDEDRRLFIATLGEACAKTEWKIHAFCLMDNHFHAVIETPLGNLVEGMKWLLELTPSASTIGIDFPAIWSPAATRRSSCNRVRVTCGRFATMSTSIRREPGC
jgi:hypothetical protein